MYSFCHRFHALSRWFIFHFKFENYDAYKLFHPNYYIIKKGNLSPKSSRLFFIIKIKIKFQNESKSLRYFNYHTEKKTKRNVFDITQKQEQPQPARAVWKLNHSIYICSFQKHQVINKMLNPMNNSITQHIEFKFSTIKQTRVLNFCKPKKTKNNSFTLSLQDISHINIAYVAAWSSS